MAQPIDHLFEAVPAYVVYRDLQPGEPFDPTSPLLFFPPKGSDELFDALRIAFPHLKTHSERMRDAIIQFLLNERQEEQLQASPAMTMDTTAPTWPSMSSSGSASVFSSPDLLDLPTPTSFANSPQAQTPQLARQTSMATTSPPSLDQMTGVFSLSVEAQPKQRVRRKMTEAEKVEYRKRRIVKACDKCAKRKRKCPHNQSQMEVVPASKSGGKTVKPVSHRSSKTGTQITDAQNLTPIEPFMADSLDFTADLDMISFQSFDDFPMFEDPMQEFTVDDLMYFDQPGANFQPQDYFSPNLSPSQHSRSRGSVNHNFEQAQPETSSQHVPGGTRHAPQPGIDENHELHSRDRATKLGSKRQSRRSGMRVSTEAEARNNLPLGVSHGQAGSPQQGGQQDGDQNRHGNGMLWEHLRTGQQGAQQPTHTAHVHKAGCGEILGLAEANGLYKALRPKPTLPQVTLQLVGTAKAIRTFAGLVRSSDNAPSRRQLVSMSRVVHALKQSAQQELAAPGHHVLLHPSAGQKPPQRGTPGLSDSALRKSTNRSANAVQRAGQPVHASTSTGKPELRLQTSTSVSQSGGLRIGTAALPLGRPQPRPLAIGQNHDARQTLLTSSSTFENAPVQERRIAPASKEAANENHNRSAGIAATSPRKLATTLGQGIANLNSMSTELYMLRRRIPRKPGTNQNHQHTTNTVNYQDVQLSAQANGGAYQQLQPRDAHAAANGSGRTPAIALTPAAFVGTHKIKDAKTIDAAMAAQSAFTYHGDLHGRADKIVQKDRLRDTNRHRDHHGRPSVAATTLLATVLLFGAMLVAGMLPTVVACYAAWYSCFSLEKEELVRCTKKNSSWLGRVLSRQMDLAPAQKRGRTELDGVPTASEAWLKGVMYPFAYSPVRFATMI